MNPTFGRAAQAFAAVCVALLAVLGAGVAQGSAPEPGGDERARFAGVPAGKEFGFNDAFQLEGMGTELEAELTRAVGGNAVRMPMQWWSLEGTRDVWNGPLFRAYRDAYATLVSHGITPHISITHAPPWAREAAHQGCTSRAACNYPPADGMLGEWRGFVAEIASRFPQATIEVWNEQNFADSWRSGVDPAGYARVLAAAYDAAKNANSAAEVMMGGLGTAAKHQGMGMQTFLDRAYSASPSLKGHTSALNLHIYPREDFGPNSFFAQTLEAMRETRARHGDSATPIYVTEVGASTTGPGAFSEDEQAHVVLQATSRLLAMPDVSGVLISRLVESPRAGWNDPERGLGVVRHSLSSPLKPKVAFCALTRRTGALHRDCPPETRIDSGPQKFEGQDTATFTFSSPDAVVSYECSLDGGAFHSCVSPHAYQGLADGVHWFAVRARDAQSRVDPYPAVYPFVTEARAPETTISGPEGPTRNPDPRYTLAANEERVSFHCSLNGATFAPCASPYSPGPLAEGEHEIRVAATDWAGRTDPSPATILVRVDRTPPETTVVDGPAQTTNDPTPTIAFAANEPGSSFRCALDSWDFKPCATPTTVGPLADGPHAFRVQAIDPAGNADPTAAFVNFTVDSDLPDTAIVKGPKRRTKKRAVRFAFTATGAVAGYECSLDDGPYRTCETPHRIKRLKPGQHILRVRAVDADGNADPTPAERKFRVRH